MANYAPSTRARIADLITGMRVDTSILDASDYLKNATATEDIFNVYGRIKVMQLFMEVITLLDTKATVMYYTYTSDTPAETVQPISVVSATMSAMKPGARHVCLGTTVATACVIDANHGFSPLIMKEKLILGANEGVGNIGINTTTADMLSGTIRFSLFYVPMSDGAYATNVV